MIVTLAGHVDHGKTSLVHALTGTNTDRLAEEAKRGLTIDLGFAYLNDDHLGFVDVPGHHRFIHNMVAGIADQQYALLVVAADDGPMPQTVEHLQVLKLLGLKRGVIALSKVDLVDEAQQNDAVQRIREVTQGSFLADAEIIPCASTSRLGIEALHGHLRQAATTETANLRQERSMRLPVDRAFNVKGSGTVVTGTLHAGRVSVGDQLEVFPGGHSVRVRSLHRNNDAADTAYPGDRTALNLAGISPEQTPRGSWVCQQAGSALSHMVVSVELLEDFPRELKLWTPVHVYHGTTHRIGRLGLIEPRRLTPGGQALADLECEEPLLVHANDRLLLRDFGLDRTLGGATVRSVGKVEARRLNKDRLAQLAAVEHSSAQEALNALLAIGPVEISTFAQFWDCDAAALNTDNTRAVEDCLVLTSTWQSWREQATQIAAQPTYADGLSPADLPGDIPQRFRGWLLNELVKDDALESVGGRYRTRNQQPTLPEPLQILLAQLEPLLDNDQPPSVGDLSKQLRKPLHQLTRDLSGLAKRQYLVQISANRYFLKRVLTRLANAAEALAEQGPFTVRQFRDHTGVGRNVAIEVLEHFDRKGFTRRKDNEREVVGHWD